MKPLVVRVVGNDGSFVVSLLHYLCALWGWQEKVALNIEHDVMLDPTESLREALEHFAFSLHKALQHPTPPPVVTYRSPYSATTEADAVFDEQEYISLNRANFHRLGTSGRLAILSKVYAVVSGTLDEARARRDEPSASPPVQQQLKSPTDYTETAQAKASFETEDPDLMAVQSAVFGALEDRETLHDGMNRAFATCFPSGCRNEWERWLWICMVQGMLARIPELPEVMAFGNEKEQADG